jgi:hypothetical protein
MTKCFAFDAKRLERAPSPEVQDENIFLTLSICIDSQTKRKQTPWSESASELHRKRPPLVGEVIGNFCG